ncbi:MAG: site-2 protease family protein [Acidobacteriia bacterium]|nr:site-2 protease family protein [Terriglobia bacterium]
MRTLQRLIDHYPMSSQFDSHPPEPYVTLSLDEEAVPIRHQPKYWLHGILFVATLFTTLVVGTQLAHAYTTENAIDLNLNFFLTICFHPTILLAGLPFSFTLMGILLSHEMGHYVACKYYRIEATLPYFIPAPTLIGTLGAFIRIKSPITNRKALFDIGAAGPIVGFIFAIPALVLSLMYSRVVPSTSGSGSSLVFGDPLIFKFTERLLRLKVPEGFDIYLHPVAFAAWVGIFATALNLLPIGQLDGGHILYSVLGKHHKTLSRLFTVGLVPIGLLYWPGWLMWAVIMLFLGTRHPRLLDEETQLGPGRRLLAFTSLVIFILCFTFSPFSIR